MNPGRAGFDHRFDQFEDVERSAETGFRIGDNGNKPVDVVFSFRVRDLIGALQRQIDAFNHSGNAVRGIQTLVRIHLPGEICVCRHLPAAEIDRL